MLTTAEFLARLGPANFIRAIWPKKVVVAGAKQLNEAVPQGKKDSYAFYGIWSDEVATRLHELNELGYCIYYGANDSKGIKFTEDRVPELRLVYGDFDGSEEPSHLKLPDGAFVPPHLHYFTSPGKSQSIWLIEPIPAEHQNAIHGRMVSWHKHDASTGGAARLLRLPGFTNTKYPERPLCTVTAAQDTPPLPASVINRYFGLGVPVAGNLSAVAGRAQSGSGGGSSSTAYKIDIAPPQRGAASPDLDRERLHTAFTGKKQNQKTTEIRQRLALIDPTERGDWFRVGACLHFMFDGSDEGLDLWNAWSELAPHKFDPRDNARTWEGYSAERAYAAHWGTLKNMSARCKITAASQDRLAKLDEYGLLMPDYIDMRVTAFVWRGMTSTGDKLVVDNGSMDNAYQAIEHFDPSIHWDEFAREVRTDRGSFQDADEIILFADTKEHGNRWTQADCRVAIKRYAHANSRNPALAYVQNLRGAWLGDSLLDTLFIRHLGAPDTPYIREITQLHFVAMVRRILQPGCKYDYLPILQGIGELGKSSLFSRMMPFQEWFTDAPSLDLEEKRFYPALQGKLCVEFAELDGMKRTDINKVKRIITQRMDEYTAMYGRQVTKEPRIAVFVGTTNEDKILRDMTGNRRWPIIPVTKELNFAALDAERDQLWAEAIELERTWGPLRLSSDSKIEMEAGQANSMDYEEGVEEFLDAVADFDGGFVASHTFRDFYGVDSRGRLADASKIKHAIHQIKARLKVAGWQETNKNIYISGKYPRGLYKRDVLGDIVELVHSEINGLHHKPEGMQT